MLPQALKVVEAARALGIRPGKAGIYQPTVADLDFFRALREIALAIGEFDRATAHGDDAKAMLGRALRFAAARGIDPREMVAAIGPDRPGADTPSEEAEAGLVPRPGEVGAPDALADISVSRQARLHGDAVTGKGSDLPDAFAEDPYFPGEAAEEGVTADDITLDGDGAPAKPEPRTPRPPDEDAERRRRDAAEAAAQIQKIRAAEARLDQLAQAHGWTPALKAIDAQLRRAQGALETAAAGGAPVETVGPAADRLLAFAEKALRKLEAGVFDEADMDPESPAFAPR